MVASISTFRPYLGLVTRDLSRLLHGMVFGSTGLQQLSKGCCSLRMSGYNLGADCQRHTLVPPLHSGANAAPGGNAALASGQIYAAPTPEQALVLAVVKP